MRNIKGVLHFSTTRLGGVSINGCSSLNMDFTDDDSIKNVLENRQLLADAVGFNPEAYTLSQQIHSANITIVNKTMRGNGSLSESTRIPATDAMITNEKDICLITKTADCVPIILCDPVKHIIATIHAGWRGTVQEIARKTVECMVSEFSSRPADILAGIGPSIGACCFEVGDEVIDAVKQNFANTTGFLVEIKGKEKKHMDLWYTNRYQLEKAGINQKNIETACLCTACKNDKFFSWRSNGKTTGRLASGIIMV